MNGNKYDKDMLDEINANADLCAYASETLELKPKGKNLFAHCPAHIDRTPSLCFTPENNTYHCFSCGRSGMFIGYLMDYEGLDIDAAVEKAARIAKIDTSQMCHSETIKFLKNIRRMKKARPEQYKHTIYPEKMYTKYLDEAPQEWIDEGIKPDVMKLFGIRIDRYGNRIVYPVRDISGRLLNVKGRTRYTNYKALNLAKYINYKEVGCVDYFQGLNITLPYVKEQKEIIIFESIKSVMKAYGWGYKNCVSAEKHTLTEQQEELLIKLRCDIVFAYDNDVDYREPSVAQTIDKLRRLTNVYIIKDRYKLLGDKTTKNSPADCGEEVWEELYSCKTKVT